LYFYCLYSPNTSSNFTTEEMWQGTDSDPYGDYWVETGGAYGYPKGDSRYWFWADERPGYGYSEHDLSSPAADLETVYSTLLAYEGSDSWNVYVNGSEVGHSVDNPPYGYYLSAGTEITAASGARSVGHDNYLAWYDTSDNLHYGWYSGNNHAYAEDLGAGGLTQGAVTTTELVDSSNGFSYGMVKWTTSGSYDSC
jgi:hypothetical protein